MTIDLEIAEWLSLSPGCSIHEIECLPVSRRRKLLEHLREYKNSHDEAWARFHASVHGAKYGSSERSL
jgi:hypothetical protein